MQGNTATANGRPNGWGAAIWGTAAALLLLPAIAMQFSSGVDWSGSDFIVMGGLLGGVALGIQFLTARSGSLAYRLGAVLAMVSALMILWVNLAVGMIGDGDNIYSLLFVGVIGVAAIGAISVRFQPAGMARVMFVAATAHVAVAVAGLSSDPRGAVLSMAMAALWAGSAALFWKAGGEARQL